MSALRTMAMNGSSPPIAINSPSDEKAVCRIAALKLVQLEEIDKRDVRAHVKGPDADPIARIEEGE